MSHTINTQILEARYADFGDFLSKRKYKDAHAIIADVREMGFEREADFMHKQLLKQQIDDEDDVTFEPYEHPEPPVLESWWQEEYRQTVSGPSIITANKDEEAGLDVWHAEEPYDIDRI